MNKLFEVNWQKVLEEVINSKSVWLCKSSKAFAKLWNEQDSKDIIKAEASMFLKTSKGRNSGFYIGDSVLFVALDFTIEASTMIRLQFLEFLKKKYNE